MRFLLYITLILTAAVVHAESYSVIANYPGIFALTVSEAEGTTYTLNLLAVDDNSSVTVSGAASNDEITLVFRGLPTDGREFTAELFRDGVKIVDRETPYRLFDAIGYYPQNLITALNTEADIAGYSGAQKLAIRQLLEKTAVRLENKRLAEIIAAEESATARKKAILTE